MFGVWGCYSAVLTTGALFILFNFDLNAKSVKGREDFFVLLCALCALWHFYLTAAGKAFDSKDGKEVR